MVCECRIFFHCYICVFLYIPCVESLGVVSWKVGCVWVLQWCSFCWSVWLFIIVLLSGLGISVFLLCGIAVVWGLCVVRMSVFLLSVWVYSILVLVVCWCEVSMFLLYLTVCGVLVFVVCEREVSVFLLSAEA